MFSPELARVFQCVDFQESLDVPPASQIAIQSSALVTLAEPGFEVGRNPVIPFFCRATGGRNAFLFTRSVSQVPRIPRVLAAIGAEPRAALHTFPRFWIPK